VRIGSTDRRSPWSTCHMPLPGADGRQNRSAKADPQFRLRATFAAFAPPWSPSIHVQKKDRDA